jgi:hypothetical protein
MFNETKSNKPLDFNDEIGTLVPPLSFEIGVAFVIRNLGLVRFTSRAACG